MLGDPSKDYGVEVNRDGDLSDLGRELFIKCRNHSRVEPNPTLGRGSSVAR